MLDVLVSNSSLNVQVHGNASVFCEDPVYYKNNLGIIVDWVIFLVGLPEVCLASYALLCLVRKDAAAPILALNLLLSDFLQIMITLVFIISRFYDSTVQSLLRARCIARLFVRLGLSSSLAFMLLISAERYVMVAYPVWYHTKNSTNLSFLISVCTWILSLAYSSLDYYFLSNNRFPFLAFSIFCLLPAPFLLGFFVATWRALNKSRSLRHNRKDRWRILGALGLVLGTYTVLFFPFSFRNLYYSLKGPMGSDVKDFVRDWSGVLTSALVYASPLIDSILYIFIRRDVRDTVEAFSCC